MEKLTTALELAGFVAIVAAAATVSLTAGLAVGGVAAIVVGWLLGRRG